MKRIASNMKLSDLDSPEQEKNENTCTRPHKSISLHFCFVFELRRFFFTKEAIFGLFHFISNVSKVLSIAVGRQSPCRFARGTAVRSTAITSKPVKIHTVDALLLLNKQSCVSIVVCILLRYRLCRRWIFFHFI